MKKILIILGTGIALVLTFCWQLSTAQASTWHNGTPAKIRGYYHSEAIRYWGSSLPFKITKHTIQWKASNRVWHGSTSGRYRVIKKNWYALAFVPGQGVSGVDRYIVHYVNHHRLNYKEKLPSSKRYDRMVVLYR